MPLPRISLAVGLLLILATTPGQSQTNDSPPLAGSLHQGTLPNGLRYVVLPHHSPTRDLSLRLVVSAGSLDETDEERGYAHFVEHMAFNGSRNLPAGTLQYFFQQLGLPMGSHLNASTTYNRTVFQLNLTAERRDRLDDCLIVLRDYADGLLFPEAEVSREIGVIASELRSRDSTDARMAHALLSAVFEGTRLPERNPIGVIEQIKSATPERLRAYYVRNYTPARMTVVVAGDIEPSAVLAKIQAEFGSLPASDRHAAAASVTLPPIAGRVRAAVVDAPAGFGAQLNLGALLPRPEDTPEGRRRELARRLAVSLLDFRLRQRQEAARSRFGGAQAHYEPLPFAPLVHARIIITARADAWDDSIELAETELRRVQQLGFTPAERDEAVARQLAALRTLEADVANLPASRVANDLVTALATGRTWRPAAEQVAETTTFLQELTEDELTESIRDLFNEESLHVVLIAPVGSRVTSEKILAAYEKSSARSLRNRAGTTDELEFAYHDFGPPGGVVNRAHHADLDLTTLAFANGVRLNVRPSTLEPHRFRLRIDFPKNHSNVSRERGGLLELAGHLLTNSSLRRHKPSELARLLGLHGVRLQFAVETGNPVFTLHGPAEELPFALQLVTALFSDLKFEDENYRAALSRYATQQRRTTLNPATRALHEAIHVYTQQDRRLLLNHPRHFASPAARTDTEKWLREHILNGPLEIGLIGDFDPEAAITTAAATVGTLPRRRAAGKPGAAVAASQKALRNEATLEIDGTSAGSCILWPIDKAADARQEVALRIAIDAINERLRLALREALGAAYSPQAHVRRDRVQPNFAYVALTNTFESGRAVQVTEGCIRLAARTAERGLSPEEFARILEPARTRARDRLRNNAWWLEAVAVAQTRPSALESVRRHDELHQEITLEEVNAALARTFKADRVTAFIVNPAPAKQP